MDAEEARLSERLPDLRKRQTAYRDWTARLPEASRRLDQLAAEVDALDYRLGSATAVCRSGS